MASIHSSKRKIIYIPIMHSLNELHTPNKEYKKELGKKYPSFSKELKKSQIFFWNKIERYLKNKKIDKIYQDSYCFPFLFPGHFIEVFNPSHF